jgi:hypothetical protein
MTDLNQNLNEAKDLLNLEEKDMQKLPQMLNVLTILTYIGCGLGALMAILAFVGVGFLKSFGGKETSAVMDTASGGSVMMAMIIGLVGIALCFYGAMKMRNLQKTGFFIYIAGQLIPIIFTFVTVGMSFGIVGVIIPLVFIALYATQFKFLK